MKRLPSEWSGITRLMIYFPPNSVKRDVIGSLWYIIYAISVLSMLYSIQKKICIFSEKQCAVLFTIQFNAKYVAIYYIYTHIFVREHILYTVNWFAHLSIICPMHVASVDDVTEKKSSRDSGIEINRFQGANATVDLRGQGCIRISTIYHDHATVYTPVN